MTTNTQYGILLTKTYLTDQKPYHGLILILSYIKKKKLV